MSKLLKLLYLFCAISAIVTLFASCAKSNETKEITCSDVITTYEEAGYDVWHKEYDDIENGVVCNVKASSENGEYIYFSFFESSEEAEKYKEEREYSILHWALSGIYGDSSWITTKAYRNIEIEYDNSDLYEPFKKLVK